MNRYSKLRLIQLKEGHGEKMSCILPELRIPFWKVYFAIIWRVISKLFQIRYLAANVFRFCSSTIDQNNQVSSSLFPQLFSNGIGMLTYFGHSSASTLGFNLDDPSLI